MSYETLIFEEQKGIGIIRLNRPERMNAVIEQMYRELQDVLNYAKSSSIRALILTGSIYKKNDIEKQAFCAGADLKKHASGERTIAQQRQYIELAHATTANLYNFPKPIIAAVNGPARGAGAEMALNTDFIFMADTATIAFPEIALGTFVGGGVSKHLTEIVGLPKAKELIYTGKILDGKEAVAMGLAAHSYPVAILLDKALDFALMLASKAPISLEFAKSQLHSASGTDLQKVIDQETEKILACMQTADWREGIKAVNEKRKPVFQGK